MRRKQIGLWICNKTSKLLIYRVEHIPQLPSTVIKKGWVYMKQVCGRLKINSLYPKAKENRWNGLSKWCSGIQPKRKLSKKMWPAAQRVPIMRTPPLFCHHSTWYHYKHPWNTTRRKHYVLLPLGISESQATANPPLVFPIPKLPPPPSPLRFVQINCPTPPPPTQVPGNSCEAFPLHTWNQADLVIFGLLGGFQLSLLSMPIES